MLSRTAPQNGNTGGKRVSIEEENTLKETSTNNIKISNTLKKYIIRLFSEQTSYSCIKIARFEIILNYVIILKLWNRK